MKINYKKNYKSYPKKIYKTLNKNISQIHIKKKKKK